MSRLYDAVQKSKGNLTAPVVAPVPAPIVEGARDRAQPPVAARKTRTIKVDTHSLKQNRVLSFDKNEPEAESFALLRTKVLHQMTVNGWNSLGITAPHEGAGKSLVAVNLAYSLLLEGNKNILLVDLDLRRPTLHKYFDFTPEFGLVDYVRNGTPLDQILVSPEGDPKLSVLPSKGRTLHSSETLTLPKMRELLWEMKSRYDDRIIIFDMPPCLITDDVMVSLPYVDCSILVAEDGRTKEDELKQAHLMLNEHGFLGVVLNRVKDTRKIYVY
ncbi:CpsD/CapB family tyrosine-protein kinase [Litorivicinus lipolyticus]|uniref:CpsD/CapB family tyrosine-protein kinase n=1 Tax=Litorivicinus lipolyticus TaxID=418701 RepID=UPI003B5A4411